MMGRKNKPEPDDRDQSARFVEVAERIEDDDAKQRFNKTAIRILRARSLPDRTEEQH